MAELYYKQLSEVLQERIAGDAAEGKLVSPYAFPNAAAIRRNQDMDKPNLWRTAFIRDAEKILNSAYYNRYADKTQVFSFYKNDDITRRALHVQLVSRIARSIGGVLGLNLDLIEAIALGHDIGHTPLGHAGETYLNQLYYEETGRYFKHNVHSVRVLDGIFPYNISLQTLDGIICHDGEFELAEYRPQKRASFLEFDEFVEKAYVEKDFYKQMIPSTLEGCLVRICDIIAYLGKDRQDADRADIALPENKFAGGILGTRNAEIINNLTVNIIENSYGKDFIKLEPAYYAALKESKQDNYQYIYQGDTVSAKYENIIKPMFANIYYRLLEDLKSGKKDSVIFRHHIDFVNNATKYHYKRTAPYIEEEPNQIVVDYIASMTDDYFVDLHKYLFPKSLLKIEYISYFRDMG